MAPSSSLVNRVLPLLIILSILPPITFTLPTKKSQENDDYYDMDPEPDNPEDAPTALIYLAPNASVLKSFLKSRGPDTYVFKQGSVLILHRVRRQTGGGGTGGGGSAPPPDPTTPTDEVLRPVLPITGEKKYNDTDCMPLAAMAAIVRSSKDIYVKQQEIEPGTCNMAEGLECLPGEKKGGTGGLIPYRCGCQLVYGPKAVYGNYTDNTGRIRKKCFLPAGLGWASECHEKSYNNYGYPLPFGDPPGTNAEAAAQTDAFFKPDGEQVLVEYIRWNSIKPQCVPFSECRERGTYRGQRCQCKTGHKLLKPEGKCNGQGSWKMEGIRGVVIGFGVIASIIVW